MARTRIAVIAGTYGEYKYLMDYFNLDRRTWFYANKKERIMGFRNGKYILIGRYWLNPIYDNEPYIFKLYNMQELKVSKRGVCYV